MTHAHQTQYLVNFSLGQYADLSALSSNKVFKIGKMLDGWNSSCHDIELISHGEKLKTTIKNKYVEVHPHTKTIYDIFVECQAYTVYERALGLDHGEIDKSYLEEVELLPSVLPSIGPMVEITLIK